MNTKFSALIALVGFAGLSISQAQVADSGRIAFCIANTCKESCDQESQGHARPGGAPNALAVAW